MMLAWTKKAFYFYSLLTVALVKRPVWSRYIWSFTVMHLAGTLHSTMHFLVHAFAGNRTHDLGIAIPLCFTVYKINIIYPTLYILILFIGGHNCEFKKFNFKWNQPKIFLLKILFHLKLLSLLFRNLRLVRICKFSFFFFFFKNVMFMLTKAVFIWWKKQ